MRDRWIKIIASILGVVILSPCIYFCGMMLLTTYVMGGKALKESIQWREYTTPLEPEVIQDICQQFVLPADDWRCLPGAVVYAPHFVRIIEETFQPENGKWATYDEIEEKLGKYKVRQSPITLQGDGTQYFSVVYDLRGDGVYPIGIFFYSDGSLQEIRPSFRLVK